MKQPSTTDKLVKVRAYLTDEAFGYDHWRAAQFSAPNVPSSRYALLQIFDSEAERDAAASLSPPGDRPRLNLGCANGDADEVPVVRESDARGRSTAEAVAGQVVEVSEVRQADQSELVKLRDDLISKAYASNEEGKRIHRTVHGFTPAEDRCYTRAQAWADVIESLNEIFSGDRPRRPEGPKA